MKRASPAALPIIDGTLGVRASVWYRRDGGYIDRINPVNARTDSEKHELRSNHAGCGLPRSGRQRAF